MTPLYSENGFLLADGNSLRGCCCSSDTPPPPSENYYRVQRCDDFTEAEFVTTYTFSVNSVYNVETSLYNGCIKILSGSSVGLPSLGTYVLHIPTPNASCVQCNGIPYDYKITMCADSSEYVLSAYDDYEPGYYVFSTDFVNGACGYLSLDDTTGLDFYAGYFFDYIKYNSCADCNDAYKRKVILCSDSSEAYVMDYSNQLGSYIGAYVMIQVGATFYCVQVSNGSTAGLPELVGNLTYAGGYFTCEECTADLPP